MSTQRTHPLVLALAVVVAAVVLSLAYASYAHPHANALDLGVVVDQAVATTAEHVYITPQ
jgi:uncharacterized membrane protein